MNSDEYLEYLQTEEWRERREACLYAAEYSCVVCSSEYNLQAHHRTYERIGRELPGDLTCLCDDCHRLYSEKVKMPWAEEVSEVQEEVGGRKGDRGHACMWAWLALIALLALCILWDAWR